MEQERPSAVAAARATGRVADSLIKKPFQREQFYRYYRLLQTFKDKVGPGRSRKININAG